MSAFLNIRVHKTPTHLGVSPWSSLLKGAPDFPILEEKAACDVLIIGGGFAGLSAARRLKTLDPNLNIALLEAQRIAEGSSGRNSGFMIDLPHELTAADYAGGDEDKNIIALNRYAIAFAKAVVDDYDIPEAYYAPIGKINGAVSNAAHAHNQSYAKHLSLLGERFEHLDQQQMKEITGSNHYQSGLFTAGTVLLQPAGYITGLAKGLSQSGVGIYAQSPVIAYEKQGSDWVVQTPKGQLSAPNLILAVNGHLESFGHAANQLMQVFLFGIMTQALSKADLKKLGGHDHWGITPSDPMGTTVRKISTAQGGNRIITRTCSVMRSDLLAKPWDLKRASQTMRQKFDERFPQLAGMPMEHQWSGHLCLTRNGVSLTKQLDEGLYAACVQNGLGLPRGTLSGIAAAEAVLGHENSVGTFFAAESAPAILPPKPLRDWGANAYMRTREWKARFE